MLHQIGVGALGPVFRTYEPTRDRLVAVKVFRLDIVPEQAQALADELSRASEAGLFHPSIVEPIAAGVEGTLAYRAEEYVAAESLDVAMRHYAPAPIDRALPFITQLAGAIDFARAAGVGHGALHPRDIFVTPDEARATGFGVVEALERAGVRAPVRRPYTAPERIDGSAWSTPADVFSLAAIAFELLTGRRPAGTGERIGALNGEGAQTDAIHSVLARAMDQDPARRHQNALAFAGALELAARDGGEPAREPTVAAAPVITAPPVAEPAIATPGELTAEEQLDPIHAAIEDSAAPSLFDAAEPASTATVGRTESAPAEAPAAAREYEPVVAPEPEPELDHYTIDDASYRANEPTYEREPELRETPERSRPATLPIAVTLVFGLLVGFAAGYFVGGREGEPSTAAPAVSTRAEPPATPSGTSARQYSEQAVTAPQPSASKPSGPPASEAPPVVSEETPTPADRAAAASRPSGARPAPAPAVAESGSLMVRSTPARASVTVNGRWRGRTPLTLDELPFGRYVVRVVEPGYRVERDEFSLTPRDATHSITVRLSPEKSAPPRTSASNQRAIPSTRPASPTTSAGTFTGGLYVDSRPQGANVMLDGRIVGRTPLRLADVRIGTHVVRLELAEHRPWTSVATVTAGQENRVTGSLERFQ